MKRVIDEEKHKLAISLRIYIVRVQGLDWLMAFLLAGTEIAKADICLPPWPARPDIQNASVFLLNLTLFCQDPEISNANREVEEGDVYTPWYLSLTLGSP